MKQFCVCCVWLLLASGCADQSPPRPEHYRPAPPPPPGYATLYIARDNMDTDAGSPTAYLNDVKVANLEDSGSYTYVYVWPGKYHVRAHSKYLTINRDDRDRALDVVIPTAGNYYLLFGDPGSSAVLCYTRFACHQSGAVAEHDWLLVPATTARRVLKHTRYMPAYTRMLGHQ